MADLHQIWYVASLPQPQQGVCSQTGNSENKMAADAILDFHTKLNKTESIQPIVIKL